MEAKVHLRHAGRRAGKRKLTGESWEGMLQFNFEFQWVLGCVTQRQLLVVVPLYSYLFHLPSGVCVERLRFQRYRGLQRAGRQTSVVWVDGCVCCVVTS